MVGMGNDVVAAHEGFVELAPNPAEGGEDDDGRYEGEDGVREAGKDNFLDVGEEAGMFVSISSSGERGGEAQ